MTPFWAIATITEINGGPSLMAADYCRGRPCEVNMSPRGAGAPEKSRVFIVGDNSRIA
jgi:hypothetical protein